MRGPKYSNNLSSLSSPLSQYSIDDVYVAKVLINNTALSAHNAVLITHLLLNGKAELEQNKQNHEG